MTASNQTPDESEADLRRAFELALADGMRGDKVNASMLDVVRRYLADRDAERRWKQESQGFAPADDSAKPAQPASYDPSRLPFPTSQQIKTGELARNVGPLSRAGDFGFAAS